MEKPGFVYIVTNKRAGTLYIGVTSDLVRRIYAHREALIDGYSKRHGCRILVWYQAFEMIEDARYREVQMKEWQRAWKIRLIEVMNPDWSDLYPSLL
ncbi:GIY-YIG nuclease family protein [Sphingomonas prati]|uniref:Putative endonuclease n=1 Tax=Sphingomonas prati TaxID=1843237 RepID=A0A7W9BQ08_9SPHN|nr:GIY-YIG nuclease family protein [Sphingomonas prati]MBB5727826.1 putative endonuclease [Sphingomonas prati]GGE81016.1 endonuclease [Sphingomonas prati]